MKLHYSIITLLLLVLLCDKSLGQSKLDSLQLINQRNIRSLITQARSMDRNEIEVINEIRTLYKTSTSLFNKINGDGNIREDVDTVFVNSLVGSQKSLEHIAKNWNSDQERWIELIKYIEKDYSIKLNASSLAASSKTRTLIKVNVQTKTENGKTLTGYDVRGNRMWDYDKNPAGIFFNNPTNDAEKNLAPGYYMIWIEKEGERVKGKRVEIGNVSDSEENIIFIL